MRDSEIRVIRICERYVKENLPDEGYFVSIRYFPERNLREIEIECSNLKNVFFVQVDMIKGKITEISEGTEKGLVDFLKKNLPSKLLNDAEIPFG